MHSKEKIRQRRFVIIALALFCGLIFMHAT